MNARAPYDDYLAMLHELCARKPWGAHTYTPEYNADPRPHRDAAHALQHLVKAAGKLARAVRLHALSTESGGAALADLVICAVRFGHVWPRGAMDASDVLVAATRRLVVPRANAEALCLGLLDALGVLAASLDRLDHAEPIDDADVTDALGLVLIYPLRIAAQWAGRTIDVPDEVRARLAAKGLAPAGSRA